MLPLLVLAAADAIVMDGDFNDWNGVTNTICVDAFDAAAGGPDLGTTKWTANGDTLHLWLGVSGEGWPHVESAGNGLPPCAGDGHGWSAPEWIKPPRASGSEAMLSMPGPDRRDPNKPGMRAGTSAQFRWQEIPSRMGRGRDATRHGLQGLPPLPPPPAGRLNFRWTTPGFLSGKSATLKWVVLDGAGGVVDETPASTIALPKFAPAKPTMAPSSDFDRAADVDFRLVNWNVEWGNLLMSECPRAGCSPPLPPMPSCSKR